MADKLAGRPADILGGPWTAANQGRLDAFLSGPDPPAVDRTDVLAMAWVASLDELGLRLLDGAGRPAATASISLAFRLAQAFSEDVIPPGRANFAPELEVESPDSAYLDDTVTVDDSAEAPSAQILHPARGSAHVLHPMSRSGRSPTAKQT